LPFEIRRDSPRIVEIAKVLFVLLAAQAVPNMAHGQNAEKATVLFKQGNELRRSGNYQAALGRYNDAYKLYPNYRIVFNIALTHEKLGNNVHAYRSYKKFLEISSGRSPERKLARAHKKIFQLEKKLSFLNVSCKKEGATIWVDGTVLDRSLLKDKIALIPGTHNFVARAKGHWPYSRSLETYAGVETSLEIVLRPYLKPSAPAPATRPSEPDEEESPPDLATPLPGPQEDHHAEDSSNDKADINRTVGWALFGTGLALAAGAGALYGVGYYMVDKEYKEYSSLTLVNTDFESSWNDVEQAGYWYVGGHVMAGLAITAIGTSIILLATRTNDDSESTPDGTVPPLSINFNEQGASLVFSRGF